MLVPFVDYDFVLLLTRIYCLHYYLISLSFRGFPGSAFSSPAI